MLPVSINRINALHFYVKGNDEIRDDSYVTINNKEIFRGLLPERGGVYDPAMGTTSYEWDCITCRNQKSICPGHCGLLELKYPVKNPLFREQLFRWLKIICFSCGQLITRKILDNIPSTDRLTEYTKLIKNISSCEYCGAERRGITRDKYEQGTFHIEKINGRHIEYVELFNNHIQNALEMVTDETVRKVGLPPVSHPRKFILNAIKVPANTIRPDIRRLGSIRSSTSDTTILLKNIIEINEMLPDTIPADDQITKDIRERYFNIDMAYFEMIKGSTGTNNQVRMISSLNKAMNSLANRIPSKEGRIRRNLMGKRVRHMGRSVITSDNLLRIDEVGIPIEMATNISIPEVVSMHNRDRLLTYYLNGRDRYPGCSKICKKSNGRSYMMSIMNKNGNNYAIQIGDIIYRDVIDSDPVLFNRQPSLLWSNVSAMKVKVLREGLTLRMNTSACSNFNADFDGDQMNVIFVKGIQSRNEIRKISALSTRMISYQSKGPMMGSYYDSLIGMSELSRSNVTFDKWHAMSIFGMIQTFSNEPIFKGKIDASFTGRDLINLIMPLINIRGRKSSMYLPQYESFIKYNKDDIMVEINNGKLVSGVLDKATIGQSTMNSIYHLIANEYGYDAALETIYSYSQLTAAFLYNHGFSLGVSDLILSNEAYNRIKLATEEMIIESRRITDRLYHGELTAPIGTTLLDYYEAKQLNALSPGDSFIVPILSDIDFNTNRLTKLVFTGSKGSTSNIISINAACGSTSINGRRPIRSVGFGRTSPYFTRFDTEPIANGYISTSYNEGLLPETFAFAAGEARHGIISKSLSTSITGYQNRISIKNLESLITDNTRRSMKNKHMVQPLYAEQGADMRRLEKVKFIGMLNANAAFKKEWHAHAKDFTVIKKAAHSTVQSILDDEYAHLVKLRGKYRDIYLNMEASNIGGSLITDVHFVPVNVPRIINDILSVERDSSTTSPQLDPVKLIKQVNDLCKSIGYGFYNKIYEKKQGKIAYHLRKSLFLVKLSIRIYMASNQILKKKITNKMVEVIITRIKTQFKKALVHYGTAIGIIAAQCVGEPQTQYVLDAKHKVGGGGSSMKTNAIVRVKEIMGAVDTSKMKNSSMLIVPKDCNSRGKVQEVANHIEMLDMSRFVYSSMVFYEQYGKPIHPRFKYEADIIAQFEKYNYGIDIPRDISSWCIRFELSRETLMVYCMKLETIINAIRVAYPQIFFVYTPEISDKVIIRCYPRLVMIKPMTSEHEEEYIISLMHEMSNTVIRGTRGILTTHLIQIPISEVNEDGSIKTVQTYAIDATGTNLYSILRNPYIDPYRTQTDSLTEFEEIYGIEAARSKIIVEMLKALPNLSKEHCTIFADEMTFSGKITSIQKTGLQIREPDNITLRTSFQSPIQILQDAALNGTVDNISGISGPLMVGALPKVGTLYNKIIVDEEFIKESVKQMVNIEDEL